MSEQKQNIFGYFDSPEQTSPAFDPGYQVSCPFCDKPLGDRSGIVATSLMRQDRIDNRSYFYRSHRTCRDWATDDQKIDIESRIIDAPDHAANLEVLSTTTLEAE